jgi:hypothetical protein
MGYARGRVTTGTSPLLRSQAVIARVVMRYHVEAAATSLEPLRATSAVLTDAMRSLAATVTVADAHHIPATMTIEAGDLPEAIHVGLDAWLIALRSAGGACAMGVSATRAE